MKRRPNFTAPRWTDAELDDLRKRWRGRPTPALVRRFGRSASAIRTAVARFGLAPARPKVRRSHFARWTPEDDQKLREMWGDYSEREIRDALGRTVEALYRRAYLLGLGAQAKVARAVAVCPMSKRLGLSPRGLTAILDECGVIPTRGNPCSRTAVAAYRHRVVDPDAVEALYRCRETRTTTRVGWQREQGIKIGARAEREAVRARLRDVPAQSRVPVGVLDEAYRGERGTWTEAWELAVAACRESPGWAPWLITLAAHDLAHLRGKGSKLARAWVEWIPKHPLEVAKALARRIAPPKKRPKRKASGPTLVRAADSTRRDGRAREPAAPTSTGTRPDLERRSA